MVGYEQWCLASSQSNCFLVLVGSSLTFRSWDYNDISELQTCIFFFGCGSFHTIVHHVLHWIYITGVHLAKILGICGMPFHGLT